MQVLSLSITADKLDLRLDPAEVPVELATLVDSFNTMIERLEDGFERLSHFSADIAHELRTPITNLTTHTQVALSKPRDASHYQEVLYSNLEEYERMTKMVSDMLLLAQTEHGLIKPNHTIINVKSELKELFEFFELLILKLFATNLCCVKRWVTLSQTLLGTHPKMR